MKNKLLIFENIDVKNTISILIYIAIFSSIFGFIYEEIFYYIDLGYLTKRGSTFGPWIPIYAYGSLLIAVFTYKLRTKPIIVFLVNILITGLLEYFTGFVLLNVFHKRLWNYNIEKWNFLNINGFICLRSVLFFGLSSLFLIYVVIPFIIDLFKKYSNIKLQIISYICALLFIIDSILYLLLK